MILRPIDICDQCKMTLQSRDMIMVGNTMGEHGRSWKKLCPKCHIKFQRGVLSNMVISKKVKKVLRMDGADIKSFIERGAKFWHRDF